MVSFPFARAHESTRTLWQQRAAQQAFAPSTSTAARHLRAAVVALALGSLAWPAAWAQDNLARSGVSSGSAANNADYQWGLGVGVAADRAPYRNFNDKVQGLPLVYFENQWVNVFGPSLDVKLPSAGPVSFALRARFLGGGYKAGDSPYLSGMDKRSASVGAGIAATWRNDLVNVSGEWLEDASGKSKGRKIKLEVDRRFQWQAFDVTPHLAAHWADSKYVNYYYGVKSSESLPQRPTYRGDASVNMELGLTVGYALAPRQSVILDIHTTHYGKGIKNSPLVDRSSTNGAHLAYMYRF